MSKRLSDFKGLLFLGGGIMAERLYSQIEESKKKLIGVFDLLEKSERKIKKFKSFDIKNVKEYSAEINDGNNAVMVAIGHYAVFKIVRKLLEIYDISDRLFVVNPYSSLRFFLIDDELSVEKRIPFSDEKYEKVRQLFKDKESIKHFDLLVKSKPYDKVNDSYEIVSYESIKDMYYYTEDYWNSYDFNESPALECATVLDCGAYVGDSVESIVCSIPEKKVFYFALEPLEANVQKMKSNEKYNEICENFTVLECGVGLKNEKLYFHIPDGGDEEAGRFTDNPDGALKVLTINRIDDLSIDYKGTVYIKMDIEGSEMSALKGAEQTIKRYHPFLAICLYHRKNDLAEIPLLIERMGLSYDYYLRGGYHTILWAIPKR